MVEFLKRTIEALRHPATAIMLSTGTIGDAALDVEADRVL